MFTAGGKQTYLSSSYRWFRLLYQIRSNLFATHSRISMSVTWDTKAVPTALTAALGSKNANYNSK